MDERTAFEANIDRDPTDATNHLVYADWLDDNNEPKEAAFRRSIGEWVHGIWDGPTPEGTTTHRWLVHRDKLPKGVTKTRPLFGPLTVSVAYHSYRAMEEALRDNFRRSQKRINPEKLSRRRLVTKYRKR